MNERSRLINNGRDIAALRSAAFDLSPEPALIVAADGSLAAANEAAEALFGQGLGLLSRGRFRDALPDASPLAVLIDRALLEGGTVRERGLSINLYGQAALEADGAVAHLGDGSLLITLHARSGSLAERNTDGAGLRSVMSLSRMLAHEIKNPLAGIRGAAQLLGSSARAEDAPLAQLIVDETDRVRRLVDRMEAFSEDAPPTRAPVNIHEVLDRVRALAANGVAEGLTLKESYDPSLPPVWGDEDQLIQVVLNIVKNAAEAAHARGDGRGEVTIATAFRHGVKVRGNDGRSMRGAPLEVRVTDNGPGVPADLRERLFEPFVTTKSFGAGLGLALCAKVVAAHGGLIDFESEPGKTSFRILLPIEP